MVCFILKFSFQNRYASRIASLEEYSVCRVWRQMILASHLKPLPCRDDPPASIEGYHSLSGKIVSSGWITLSIDFIAIRFTKTLIMSLRYQASPRMVSLG